MTELQAAVGKVQLKKLNFILRENKKRYKILDSLLDKKIIRREITSKSALIHDTYIIKIKTNPKEIKLLIYLKNCHLEQRIYQMH